MTWDTNTAILARLETFSAETAWTSLVEHFERPLTRYVGRSGLSSSLVEDVVQETLVAFAEAYRGGAFDRTRGRLSGWLFGIARHKVASARRKAALDLVTVLGSAPERSLHDPDDALERIWEEEWRREILERCIARVRKEVEPAIWECFALLTLHGLSTEDVVARLGLPRTRVYNAKHRVLRRLRELEREFEDA